MKALAKFTGSRGKGVAVTHGPLIRSVGVALLALAAGVCAASGGNLAAEPAGMSLAGLVHGSVAAPPVVVTNGADHPIAYTISSDVIWLSASPAAGAVDGGAATQHEVRVSVRGMRIGLHRGRLLIDETSGTGTPVIIDVTVAVTSPCPPTVCVAWGNNANGQASVPESVTNAVQVSAGDYHSLSLSADGRVTAWGRNDRGQAAVPAGLPAVAAVAAGSEHSLALLASGGIVGWGAGDRGQTNVPACVSNAAAIAAGHFHSLAALADGRVVAWGDSNHGQTNVPSFVTNAVAVSAGDYHSLALLADGRVVAWGYNGLKQTNVPAGVTDAVAVRAGANHSLALCADGRVVAWGDSFYGQTNVPSTVTNGEAVAGGEYHSLVLQGDGRVTAWGLNLSGQGSAPADLAHVFDVAAGAFHNLALVEGRSLRVESAVGATVPAAGVHARAVGASVTASADPWVTDGHTQYVCSGWSGEGSVPAAGTSNTVAFALLADSVIAWQWQTNYWLDIRAIGGGDVSATSAWWLAGSPVSVTATQVSQFVFVRWSGDTNGCASAGDQITIPMDRARRIWAEFTGPVIACTPTQIAMTGRVNGLETWERTVTVSNIGLGSMDYTFSPDQFWMTVTPATGHVGPGGGVQHTVRVSTRGLTARTYHGAVTIHDPLGTNTPQVIPVALAVTSPCPLTACVAWGDGSEGQTNVPCAMTNAVSVSGGVGFSLALLFGGRAIAWGDNSLGQTNVPACVTDAVAVAAGAYHALALRSDGRVAAWGHGGLRQTEVPAGLSDAVWVAAGAYHSLALRASGQVAAWGYNACGQTNVPDGVVHAVGVAGGGQHSLAVLADGRVVGWGYNSFGQATVPATVTNAVAVAAGDSHSLALLADGRVIAWGLNDEGQAIVPGGVTNAVAVAAGDTHSLALLADGRIVGWGGNGSGAATVPPQLPKALVLGAGGQHSLGIAEGRLLTVVSDHGAPYPPAGRHIIPVGAPIAAWAEDRAVVGATQYACVGWAGTGSVPPGGGSNTVGFTMAGESRLQWLWATNYWLDVRAVGGGDVSVTSAWWAAGSVINVTASSAPSFSFIRWCGDTGGCTIAGASIAVPMASARRVWAEFTGPIIASDTTPVALTGLINRVLLQEKVITVRNVGLGVLNYTLRSDRFWVSAQPLGGSLMAGDQTQIVVRINTRGLLARTYRGSISIVDRYATNTPWTIPVCVTLTSCCPPTACLTWGENADGQATVPTNAVYPVGAAGGSYHSLAVLGSGRVLAWGHDYYGQSDVPAGLTNATGVAAGRWHSLAVRANGRVDAWGDDHYGQASVPAGLTSAVAVAAGDYHSLALLADGRVVAWGDNYFGQTDVPSGMTNAAAVAGGLYHSLALLWDGRVVAWGHNNAGQTDVPAAVSNAVAIAAGRYHSMALLSDGRVVAWGYNGSGQTNVPSQLTDAVGIAAGGDHSLALLSYGAVAGWGADQSGEATVPPYVGGVFALAAGRYHNLALSEMVELSIASASSAYGTPRPWFGSRYVPRDGVYTASVDAAVQDGATQYVCTGWIGTGCVPPTGASNEVVFILSRETRITWQWATNVRFSLACADWGSIDGPFGCAVGRTDLWFRLGRSVTVTAAPAAYCHFTGWTGDVPSGVTTTNPLTLTASRTRTVSAGFSLNLAPQGTPERWLAGFGLTNFVAAEQGDQDGDGLRAWQEYVADTDPTNDSSRLAITRIDRVANGLSMDVGGGSNAFRCVECKSNLVGGAESWVPFITLPCSNRLIRTIEYPCDNSGRRQFRVRAWR